METLYRKVAVSERMPTEKRVYIVIFKNNKVGKFNFWDEEAFKESWNEHVNFWLEEIPDPTAQLKADKAELLHFLKYFKQCVEDEDFIMVNNTDEDIVDNLLSKFTSLIQKMKQ